MAKMAAQDVNNFKIGVNSQGQQLVNRGEQQVIAEPVQRVYNMQCRETPDQAENCYIF